MLKQRKPFSSNIQLHIRPDLLKKLWDQYVPAASPDYERISLIYLGQTRTQAAEPSVRIQLLIQWIINQKMTQLRLADSSPQPGLGLQIMTRSLQRAERSFLLQLRCCNFAAYRTVRRFVTLLEEAETGSRRYHSWQKEYQAIERQRSADRLFSLFLTELREWFDVSSLQMVRTLEQELLRSLSAEEYQYLAENAAGREADDAAVPRLEHARDAAFDYRGTGQGTEEQNPLWKRKKEEMLRVLDTLEEEKVWQIWGQLKMQVREVYGVDSQGEQSDGKAYQGPELQNQERTAQDNVGSTESAHLNQKEGMESISLNHAEGMESISLNHEERMESISLNHTERVEGEPLRYAALTERIYLKRTQRQTEGDSSIRAGRPRKVRQVRTGACLKIHSSHQYSSLRELFAPNSVNAARCIALIRHSMSLVDQSPTEQKAHLEESNFRFHSGRKESNFQPRYGTGEGDYQIQSGLGEGDFQTQSRLGEGDFQIRSGLAEKIFRLQQRLQREQMEAVEKEFTFRMEQEPFLSIADLLAVSWDTAQSDAQPIEERERFFYLEFDQIIGRMEQTVRARIECTKKREKEAVALWRRLYHREYHIAETLFQRQVFLEKLDESSKQEAEYEDADESLKQEVGYGNLNEKFRQEAGYRNTDKDFPYEAGYENADEGFPYEAGYENVDGSLPYEAGYEHTAELVEPQREWAQPASMDFSDFQAEDFSDFQAEDFSDFQAGDFPDFQAEDWPREELRALSGWGRLLAQYVVIPSQVTEEQDGLTRTKLSGRESDQEAAFVQPTVDYDAGKTNVWAELTTEVSRRFRDRTETDMEFIWQERVFQEQRPQELLAQMEPLEESKRTKWVRHLADLIFFWYEKSVAKRAEHTNQLDVQSKLYDQEEPKQSKDIPKLQESGAVLEETSDRSDQQLREWANALLFYAQPEAAKDDFISDERQAVMHLKYDGREKDLPAIANDRQSDFADAEDENLPVIANDRQSDLADAENERRADLQQPVSRLAMERGARPEFVREGAAVSRLAKEQGEIIRRQIETAKERSVLQQLLQQINHRLHMVQKAQDEPTAASKAEMLEKKLLHPSDEGGRRIGQQSEERNGQFQHPSVAGGQHFDQQSEERNGQFQHPLSADGQRISQQEEENGQFLYPSNKDGQRIGQQAIELTYTERQLSAPPIRDLIQQIRTMDEIQYGNLVRELSQAVRAQELLALEHDAQEAVVKAPKQIAVEEATAPQTARAQELSRAEEWTHRLPKGWPWPETSRRETKNAWAEEKPGRAKRHTVMERKAEGRAEEKPGTDEWETVMRSEESVQLYPLLAEQIEDFEQKYRQDIRTRIKEFHQNGLTFSFDQTQSFLLSDEPMKEADLKMHLQLKQSEEPRSVYEPQPGYETQSLQYSAAPSERPGEEQQREALKLREETMKIKSAQEQIKQRLQEVQTQLKQAKSAAGAKEDVRDFAEQVKRQLYEELHVEKLRRGLI